MTDIVVDTIMKHRNDIQYYVWFLACYKAV